MSFFNFSSGQVECDEYLGPYQGGAFDFGAFPVGANPFQDPNGVFPDKNKLCPMTCGRVMQY